VSDMFVCMYVLLLYANYIYCIPTYRKGSVGAYSPCMGLRTVRERVASYIRKRDGGVAASPDDIWIGAGASDVIKAVLTMFAGHVNGKPSCKPI
jgi:aspartate/methionine/tyrosine aminotransferase